jgi:16S rRNA (uracil1498-N3)-methyltransferase
MYNLIMPISRIFQSTHFSVNETVVIDEAASHHLARVLRTEVGDKIIIFNGQGGEYQAQITQVAKKNITVQINHFVACNRESPLDLTLAQGISRGDKMDYTIQKAVELGVKKIVPLLTERCTVKLDVEKRQKRWQHWYSIIIGACEQSGRTQLPELTVPLSLNEWMQQMQMPQTAFVLVPTAEVPLKKMSIQSGESVLLLVGPEGGLTDQEITNVCQKGFNSLNLGPRILRTETAAVAALTALQCLFGDIG